MVSCTSSVLFLDLCNLNLFIKISAKKGVRTRKKNAFSDWVIGIFLGMFFFLKKIINSSVFPTFSQEKKSFRKNKFFPRNFNFFNITFFLIFSREKIKISQVFRLFLEKILIFSREKLLKKNSSGKFYFLSKSNFSNFHFSTRDQFSGKNNNSRFFSISGLDSNFDPKNPKSKPENPKI